MNKFNDLIKRELVNFHENSVVCDFVLCLINKRVSTTLVRSGRFWSVLAHFVSSSSTHSQSFISVQFDLLWSISFNIHQLTLIYFCLRFWSNFRFIFTFTFTFSINFHLPQNFTSISIHNSHIICIFIIRKYPMLHINLHYNDYIITSQRWTLQNKQAEQQQEKKNLIKQ